MSYEGVLSLPIENAEVVLGSWITCASLQIFAWAMKRCGLSSSALQVVPAQASLSARLSKLEIRVGGQGDSSGPLSADEETLDLLVLPVESGWTSRGSCCGFSLNLGDVI